MLENRYMGFSLGKKLFASPLFLCTLTGTSSTKNLFASISSEKLSQACSLDKLKLSFADILVSSPMN
jgi:hypothetical protein